MGFVIKQPGVTWLLPVKNGMPYLQETLESIVRQNYSNHSIIAWDNGSTDKTVEILHKWIGNRIDGIVVSHKPCGLGASLAAMVAMSRTEFCARLDADDINEPNRLAVQTAFLQANPQVAIVGSSTKLIDQHGQWTGRTTPVAQSDAEIRWRLRFYNAFAHPTVMFRRQAVLDAGNYRDIMPIEDYDLWIRLAVRHEMANLAEPLLQYRLLNTSVSATNNDRIDAIRKHTIEEHAADLFAGLPQCDVKRIIQAVTAPDSIMINRNDMRILRQVATQAAVDISKPADYFCKTALYRLQLKDMRTRWLKSQRGVEPVWNIARHLRHKALSWLMNHATPPTEKAA